MKTNPKKAYTKPNFKHHGSFEQITEHGGGKSIDGIIGIDIYGDGNIDAVTGVTNGSLP